MPTKPKPHTHVARGSLDDCQDGFRIGLRAIVSGMSILDLVTLAVAGYTAMITAVLLGSALLLRQKSESEGWHMLPVFLLPFLVVADLIVRAAS